MTPKQFIFKAKKVLKDYNCELTDPFFMAGQYKKLTPFGTVQISVPDDKGCIFMRFEDDLKKELFVKTFFPANFNTYSFKWNIHSADSEYVITELANRLHLLTNPK